MAIETISFSFFDGPSLSKLVLNDKSRSSWLELYAIASSYAVLGCCAGYLSSDDLYDEGNCPILCPILC